MPDPTDAEIQAGADAIARSWRVLSHSSRRHLAKLVLTDVLPGHDAQRRSERPTTPTPTHAAAVKRPSPATPLRRQLPPEPDVQERLR